MFSSLKDLAKDLSSKLRTYVNENLQYEDFQKVSC